MKKLILFVLVILSILALTACSSSGTSSTSPLVGRWQSQENTDFQLEFTQDGKYTEYLTGQAVGFGNYQADGSTLSMHYSSPCGGTNQPTCDLEIGYKVTDTTLVITDNQGEVHFNRVNK